eukprot:TRINITY_DN11766_c0_g1_i1.p1 TRINITY_DN11766_c0_g1~~TRINITY_DN11766_c0_g1_i1.p1  ORF type:complete len:241 (-),score=67.41 TRINITY_DN11766_c0_g1_i1:19-741(-)
MDLLNTKRMAANKHKHSLSHQKRNSKYKGNQARQKTKDNSQEATEEQPQQEEGEETYVPKYIRKALKSNDYRYAEEEGTDEQDDDDEWFDLKKIEENRVSGSADHFKFKGEQEWEELKLIANSKSLQFDTDQIANSLQELTIEKRLGIDTELFGGVRNELNVNDDEMFYGWNMFYLASASTQQDIRDSHDTTQKVIQDATKQEDEAALDALLSTQNNESTTTQDSEKQDDNLEDWLESVI